MPNLRKYPLCMKLVLMLSGTMFAVLLMNTASKLNFMVNLLLALAVMAVLVFRFSLDEKLFTRKKLWVWIPALIITVLTLYSQKSGFYTCCSGWITKLLRLLQLPERVVSLGVRISPWAVALLAFPAAYGYLSWFVEFFTGLAVRLWQKSDYIDRVYFAVAAILLGAVIIFTYTCTQAFYGAYLNGIHYNYDLIYSADSGDLVNLDVFRNIGASQNDMRQPLYGLFAMPFAQLAWLVSRLFAFLPHSYITTLQIFQVLLFLAAVILLAKQMQLTGLEKALFFAMISCSYPVLIFSLTVEQYLMAVFWLILLVDLRREEPAGSLFYIAGTGSLLTTGVLFPLITWDRSFRRFVLNTLKLCAAFFAVMILCGRLTVLLELQDSLSLYGHYSGVDVSAVSKLMQFVNFAGATLLAPASQIDNFTYAYHISYQMVPVTDWNPIGFVVLILAVIGFILKRKDDFSRICFCWVLFSFVLLGLIGWGTIDNGLLLYSLYFGWAYVVLVFQAIACGLKRFHYAKFTVLACLLLVMVLVNITGLSQAIIFATQYYPMLG